MNGKLIAEKMLVIKETILGVENSPEIQEKLNAFGNYTERLAEGKSLLEKVKRDKTFDDLCKWYSKFRAIARIALYDKPQLMEALGIVRR